MVIDIHTHAFPDGVAAQAMASLEEGAGVEWHGDGTVAGLLRTMDSAGIDVSVVQPVATKPGNVARVNDWAASLASDRIVPFGAMHPDLENAPAEIERMAALGLRGFKLHPEFQGFAPDEERLEPILAAAEELGLIVLFHAGVDPGFETVRGTPDAFARVHAAHPDLTMILAHLGGFRCWDDVADVLVGLPVYLDTAYTLGHLADERFIEIVRAHGVERVLFGTDGPWTDAGHEIELVRSLPLTAEESAALLGGNARRLLALG